MRCSMRGSIACARRCGEARLDALVVYTNNTRPAGVSWLAGFVPYWSEALLVVPRDGAPYLVAALSFRVKSWIERVQPRSARCCIRRASGSRPAQQIAAEAAGCRRRHRRFRRPCRQALPTICARVARPRVAGREPLFATLRASADPAEIALAMKASAIAHHALAAGTRRHARRMIAAVESAGAGAWRRGNLHGGRARSCARTRGSVAYRG